MSLGTMEQRTEGMKKQAQELIEQAYHKGFKAGREDRQEWEKARADRLIEQGRNEAWEAAEKVWSCDHSERRKIFGVNTYSDGALDIYKNFTATEAIEKIRAYEEQKKQEETEEIKVGDEIRREESYAVVTWTDGVYWNGIQSNRRRVIGKGFTGRELQGWEKTGRHFHEIAEALEKMKEEEDV